MGFRKTPVSGLCPVMSFMEKNVSFGPLENNNLVKALANPENGKSGVSAIPLLYPLAMEFSCKYKEADFSSLCALFCKGL